MTVIKGVLRSVLQAVRRWLDDTPIQPTSTPPLEQVPFDNSYRWLWVNMEKFMNDPIAAQRPHYVWGVLQGAALGKVLGFQRVSMLEIGVAGGAGLLAMERAADLCEELANIKIDVIGFDTGAGIPKPCDYRDMPYKWSEGYYPCDVAELKKRLKRAELRIGLLKETMPAFLAQNPAPVAFVAFDTGMYSSTRDALSLFRGTHESLLPRLCCSFRSATGKDMSEYGAELLAISEFNDNHAMRKISSIRGLTYFVPPKLRWWWIDTMHSLHIFDHPLYGAPDAYNQSAAIDLDGTEHFRPAGKGSA